VTPTLFLMCGLPGAGKTTLARRLEREHHALRLTPDEWMVPLFGTHLNAQSEERRARVEALLWGVAARTLTLGVSVVLDYGLWARSERDDYRARGEAVGARVFVVYLDVPRTELLERLSARNDTQPSHTYPVTPEELDLWASWFEAPTSDEGLWNPAG